MASGHLILNLRAFGLGMATRPTVEAGMMVGAVACWSMLGACIEPSAQLIWVSVSHPTAFCLTATACALGLLMLLRCHISTGGFDELKSEVIKGCSIGEADMARRCNVLADSPVIVEDMVVKRGCDGGEKSEDVFIVLGEFVMPVQKGKGDCVDSLLPCDDPVTSRLNWLRGNK